mmetsp:Transcript_27232/g.84775  ORF Transcript_27232/g.84775 Transcript_27232/m.84775 type:complete len:234 (-) Transcript_27232:46-747(-)
MRGAHVQHRAHLRRDDQRLLGRRGQAPCARSEGAGRARIAGRARRARQRGGRHQAHARLRRRHLVGLADVHRVWLLPDVREGVRLLLRAGPGRPRLAAGILHLPVWALPGHGGGEHRLQQRLLRGRQARRPACALRQRGGGPVARQLHQRRVLPELARTLRGRRLPPRLDAPLGANGSGERGRGAGCHPQSGEEVSCRAAVRTGHGARVTSGCITCGRIRGLRARHDRIIKAI